MKKFTKGIFFLLLITVIALAACSYRNKATVPQTLSSFSSSVRDNVRNIAASGQGSSNITVQYYFPRAGQKPEPVLVNMIGSAKSSIDVAVYSFTDRDIADALIDAKKRGVAVRVISDRECSQERSQEKLLTSLKHTGIPVKVNSHAGLMHLKVTITDQAAVATGSFNYTYSAESENDEAFVVLNDKKAAGDFKNEFSCMWNDKQNYRDF